MAKAYLQYRMRAKKRHGVHSPFVYALSEEVFHKNAAKKAKEIGALRKVLLRNRTAIEVKDYGAGSRKGSKPNRTIAEIARNSTSPETMAQMMQRLISYLRAENVLELGANLGLTTAYLAAAPVENLQVKSLEGDPSLAKIAVKNLQKIGLEAEIVVGKFEDTLDLTLARLPQIDFAYIDGNHRKAPTLDYFQKLLTKTTDNSVLAFGDIHWSEGMEEAWQKIKEDDRITLTIDLFDLGLVFFRKGHAEKEHFTIRL